MASVGAHTLQEIESQAEALQDAQQALSSCGAQVAQLLQPASRVLFVGCGSALNIAFAVAPVFAISTGRLAMPVPAGGVFLYPQAVVGPSTAVVCISRSGQTTETVQAHLKFKELTLLPSDAYSLLDCRHGPMSNLGTEPARLTTVT